MKEVFHPINCQHPVHLPAPDWPAPGCHAVHPSHPECDCRWWVFNREFNKAGE